MSSTLSKKDADTEKLTLYHCGALVYTKAGLLSLFSWLLLADFSITLMGAVWQNVLPLALKSQGAVNTIVALVMSTIPSAMNFVMNPIISTASDRFRSRWGRRIPFIFLSTPFIVLFLVLQGFSVDLGRHIYSLVGGAFPSLSVSGVTVGLICFLIVGQIFFELFVGTVFWYLFNDVVPAQFMGRYLGFCRVITSLATSMFNFFLLRYAESHMALLFVLAAILYGVTLMLVAWNVKEGSYPPPPAVERKNPFEWVKIFAVECFSHRIFRRIFAYNALLSVGGGINIFAVFMALSIGLNLNEYGKVIGVASFVGMFLMYPMGSLVDRFHPLRVMIAAKVAFCLIGSIQFLFLFHEFSKPVALSIYAGVVALTIPIGVANATAVFPLLMRLFPQEKFGQFCAANAMCTAAGTVVGATVAGLFLDFLKVKFHGGDYCYRFIPVWGVCFALLCLGMITLVFREWKRLGGDANYRSPVSDSFAFTQQEVPVRQ